jgi:hypothetical protein
VRVDSTGFGASGLGSSGLGSSGLGSRLPPELPAEPPLYDPYFGGGPGEGGAPVAGARDVPTTVRVGAATWSLILGVCSFVFAPITAPIALILGVLGLRSARRLAADGWDARSPRRRARVGIALAGASLALQMVLVGYGVHRYRQQAAFEAFTATPAPPSRAVVRPVDPRAPIPRATDDRRIGKLRVVTLGAHDVSLRVALQREADAAKDDGTELLVIVVSATDCEPCEGLQASLPNPLMQEALAKHRVVFVDNEVFLAELVQMGFDPRHIAGFYLLGPDLEVRDAIHGGEWGEDIAANIAPVLGPYLRGKLDRRRHDWRTTGAFPESEAGPGTPSRRSPRAPASPPPAPSAIWL